MIAAGCVTRASTSSHRSPGAGRGGRAGRGDGVARAGIRPKYFCTRSSTRPGSKCPARTRMALLGRYHVAANARTSAEPIRFRAAMASLARWYGCHPGYSSSHSASNRGPRTWNPRLPYPYWRYSRPARVRSRTTSSSTASAAGRHARTLEPESEVERLGRNRLFERSESRLVCALEVRGPCLQEQLRVGAVAERAKEHVLRDVSQALSTVRGHRLAQPRSGRQC